AAGGRDHPACIDHLASQGLPSFERPGLAVIVEAELSVEALEGGEVHLVLLRQLAYESLLELADVLLVLIQLCLDLFQLDAEELGRPARLALADPQVLLDEE